jgi:hypothetical protein
VAGTVYAVNEKTLLIKGFKYTGEGPAAVFWVGTQGTTASSTGTEIPYPLPQHTSFNGDKDITLTLPDALKVTDIKWMSVWCKKFGVDLGSFTFPENLSFANKGSNVSGFTTIVAIGMAFLGGMIL